MFIVEIVVLKTFICIFQSPDQPLPRRKLFSDFVYFLLIAFKYKGKYVIDTDLSSFFPLSLAP